MERRGCIILVVVLSCVGSLAAFAQPELYDGHTLAQLIEALDSDDWGVRVGAGWTLSQIGPDAAPAIPALMRALRVDDDEALRMLAATALGAIGQATPEVLAALRRAVNDPHEDVRESAVWALAALGEAQAPATVAPTAPAPPTAPADTGAAEPAPAAEPATAPQGLWRLLPVEEARAAVQSAALQSHSLGLLDAEGKQVNPHVPPDAISLLPEDIAAHAHLMTNLSARSVGDVIDFLAAFDFRLAATGRTITVEDLLPDLQRYVSWCFEHPDDPRSGLGLALGSGPMLVQPDEAPTMSAHTPLSTITSMMMLADLVCGVPGGEGARDVAEWRGEASGPGVRLAALVEDAPRMRARADDPATSALQKIRGYITELDPDLVAFIGKEPMAWRHRLLALFECQNRLTVVVGEPVGETMVRTAGVLAQWRADGWWIKAARDWSKTEAIPLTARVGFVGADGAWVETPFPRLQYTARLTAGGSMRGFLDHREDWMPADKYEEELYRSMWSDAQPYAFEGPVDYGPAYARALLARLFIHSLTLPGGDVQGAESGPLALWADGRLVGGGIGMPGAYRLEHEGRTLDFRFVVSSLPGREQWRPPARHWGRGVLRVSAKLSGGDFIGFWLSHVEPLRVMGLSPAEDEALVELAADKLLGAAYTEVAIWFDSEEYGAIDKRIKLLGDRGNQIRMAQTHVVFETDGEFSGKCAFSDSRRTSQWAWIGGLSEFRGRLTERNLAFSAQRREAEAEATRHGVEVGKFEGTGTWRGRHLPLGEGAVMQTGMTGKFRINGTLTFVLARGDQPDGYRAEGAVQFLDDGEWLPWGATTFEWDRDWEAANAYARQTERATHFPDWADPELWRD